jgi:hypothetical protein
VTEVAFEALQCGDVVAFRFKGKSIAHRVVGRAGDGLITQGDANFRRDVGVLTPDRLIGKVMTRERAGIRVPVSGGIGGRCRGVFLRAFLPVRRGLFLLLAPIYRFVRVSHAVPWVWRPRIMRVRFTNSEGVQTKFIHRGRTIACLSAQQASDKQTGMSVLHSGRGAMGALGGEHEQRWFCRKPYDLILGSSRHGHEAKTSSA